MMTKREEEQLAVLTERVNQMAIQLNKNTQDTAAIKETIDNFNGGRRVIVWTISILIGLGTIAATLFEALRGVHK